MSYAVVHMQKIKAPALKGIQIHHQREKESHTNPDIQEERTHENYDLVNSQDVMFHERVKEIIESQKTGTRKIRKDAVLINELLITSDELFFKQLSADERARFFEESYHVFSERYGSQNIAYARVHLDEKTPHMHLGVVPMREGRLQSKNIFNRQELQWIQDSFPKIMQELGFDLKRGEKGSDREHIEMARFKIQTVEKETKTLEQEIADRKNELLVLNEKVPDEIEVRFTQQKKMVDVPTGEKTVFGKDKTKTVEKPTGKILIHENEFKRLTNAVKDNERMKNSIQNYLQTDVVKDNKQLRSEIEQLNGEIKALKSVNVELREENRDLKALVKRMKDEIGFLYDNTKELLKEHTSDFKDSLRSFADKIKGKVFKSEFGRLNDLEESQSKNENGYSLERLKELDQENGKEELVRRKKRREKER